MAASLLLAISTAAFFVFSNRNSNEEKIISQQDFSKNATKDDSAGNRSNGTGVVEPVTSKNDDGKEDVDPSNNLLADQKKNPVDENEKNKQQNIAAKHDAKLIAKNNIAVEPSNKLPGTDHDSNVAKGSEENPIAMVDLPKKEALTSNSDNKPIEVVTPDNTLSLDEAKTAVTIEPGYDLVTDESGKKNKLRGFFRKVTRTFEKRTNIKATDDEDRLLLAGLSIKL